MNQQNQNPQVNNPRGNANRPDIRDNLDSRKNEEQDFKGDDVTHNEKVTKEDKLKQQREDED